VVYRIAGLCLALEEITMPKTIRCFFCQDSRTVGLSKDLNTCDFDGCQSNCEGDMGFCEKPYAIRKYLGNQKEQGDAVNREIPDPVGPGGSNAESSFCKVLVVDDDENLRTLLVTLLSSKGHGCVTAADGPQALEKMKNDQFDAVITDIVMGEMDGLTLTKEILERYPGSPVMVMTGYASDHSAEDAVKAGAQEFIKKPFSIDEFVVRFDKMMRHHRQEKELLSFSLTDELTGLHNRRRFFVLMEQYLKIANRTKKRLLLLYIDMDDFKRINDQYGHNEGDRALIDFAVILKKTFRESDIIARIGGDEFVVLFESPDKDKEILITRLYENIKEYNATGSHRYGLSISLGTAQFDPEYPVSINELLSKADALMYAQKRRRKKDNVQY
jgi:two-component system, cell cycle response regulator